MRERLRPLAPWIVVAEGLLLFALAASHHLAEVAELGGLRGPGVAFAIDGGLGLVLVGLGLWLRASPLHPDRRLDVAGWTLLGAALFVGVVGLSMGVKLAEGRSLAEPAFTLLVAAGAGALAGFITGFYNAEAQEEARRARRSSEAMTVVNGIIRHDLRNDLTTVAGTADLLEDGAGDVDPDELRDEARLIQDKSEEAIELLEDTGTLARTVAGDAPVSEVDLVDVVREAARGLPDVATVETDLPDSAPVEGNEGLVSVADNLLENAVEHHDGDDPWIGVEVAVGDEAVVLRVADDGPGVPDDKKAHLFEPREGGTHGGGLHLVSTLVESLGGTIEVSDREPRGTVFTVTLRSADA